MMMMMMMMTGQDMHGMFTSPEILKLVVRQYNAAVESVEHQPIRKTFKILDEAKFHVLMVKLAKGWESNLTSTVNTLCAQDPYPPAAPWPDEDFWPSLLLKDAGTFKQRVQVPDSADTKSCTRKQVQTAWVKYFAPQLQRHKLNPPSGQTPRSYAQTKRQGKDASNTGDISSGTGKKKQAKKERVFQSLQSDGSKAVLTQQTSPAASVPPSLEAKLFSVLQQDAKAEEEAKEKVMGTLAAISTGLTNMTSVLQGIQQQQSMQQMLLMRLMQSPSAPGHTPLPQPALWEQFFSATFQPGSQPSSFPPSAQITPRRPG
jgi:hypothetical protein